MVQPHEAVLTEERYEGAMAEAVSLIEKGIKAERTPAETDRLRELAVAIQAYEAEHCDLSKEPVTGGDILHFMMEQHELSIEDLAASTGVSGKKIQDVLGGSESFTEDEAAKVSDRFHIGSELLLDK